MVSTPRIDVHGDPNVAKCNRVHGHSFRAVSTAAVDEVRACIAALVAALDAKHARSLVIDFGAETVSLFL